MFVHVSSLRLQLQILIALTLSNLERVERVTLEVRLAIEIHLIKSEWLAQVTSGSRLFDSSDSRLFLLVLSSLLLF